MSMALINKKYFEKVSSKALSSTLIKWSILAGVIGYWVLRNI
jgi:hypothetical protein